MPIISITITDAGLNLLRNGMRGADTSLIKYVAVGTDSTAPATANTRLGNEIFRRAINSYTNGSTGEVIINGYIAPNDVVGRTLNEIGFFGGNSATLATNSGILLARGLYSHTKSGTESIVAKLDTTISR